MVPPRPCRGAPFERPRIRPTAGTGPPAPPHAGGARSDGVRMFVVDGRAPAGMPAVGGRRDASGPRGARRPRTGPACAPRGCDRPGSRHIRGRRSVAVRTCRPAVPPRRRAFVPTGDDGSAAFSAKPSDGSDPGAEREPTAAMRPMRASRPIRPACGPRWNGRPSCPCGTRTRTCAARAGWSGGRPSVAFRRRPLRSAGGTDRAGLRPVPAPCASPADAHGMPRQGSGRRRVTVRRGRTPCATPTRRPRSRGRPRRPCAATAA